MRYFSRFHEDDSSILYERRSTNMICRGRKQRHSESNLARDKKNILRMLFAPFFLNAIGHNRVESTNREKKSQFIQQLSWF
jgi:hypothetical protein